MFIRQWQSPSSVGSLPSKSGGTVTSQALGEEGGGGDYHPPKNHLANLLSMRTPDPSPFPTQPWFHQDFFSSPPQTSVWVNPNRPQFSVNSQFSFGSRTQAYVPASFHRGFELPRPDALPHW